MPTLTRWFIKTALVYFAVALLMGIATQAAVILPLPPTITALRPVYTHLLMVGWVTQLIIGMAYWMFPKYSQAHPRGSERLGWATYVLLNVGLLLRVVVEPLMTTQSGNGLGWLLAISAVLQFLAGWAFIINTWVRVKVR